MHSRHPLAAAREMIRRREWFYLVRSSLGRVLPERWAYFNRLLFCRMDEVRALPLRPDRMRVRLATPDDLPAMEALHPRGPVYREKLERGDLCLLALNQDVPAAIAWFHCAPRHDSAENGFRFPLGEGGGWGYWVEVAPAFRLRGALGRLWIEGMPLLRERGVHTVFTAIEEANEASIRSHRRLGFEPIARYRMIRLFGIARYGVTTPSGRSRSGWGRWNGALP